MEEFERAFALCEGHGNEIGDACLFQTGDRGPHLGLVADDRHVGGAGDALTVHHGPQGGQLTV